jgi:hypothetical protein
VTPNSLPATNIHVLIGRDGVGWTHCFDFLARAFLGMPADDLTQPVGELRNRAANPWGIEDLNADPGFAGLITVSFGAFDSTGPLAVPAVTTSVTPMSGWSRTRPRRPARQSQCRAARASRTGTNLPRACSAAAKASGGAAEKTPCGRWRPILCLPRRTSLRLPIFRRQISNSAHAASFGG